MTLVFFLSGKAEMTYPNFAHPSDPMEPRAAAGASVSQAWNPGAHMAHFTPLGLIYTTRGTGRY